MSVGKENMEVNINLDRFKVEIFLEGFEGKIVGFIM